MSSATPIITAIILIGLMLTGCQDDASKVLSDAGVTEKQLTQTQPEPATQPSVPGAIASPVPTKPELPRGLGKYDLVHEPQQGVLKFVLLDASTKPLPELESASLSVASPDGPMEVGLGPCSPPEKGCLAAKSDILREADVRGVLRYEVNGQRFRVPVSTQKASSQPAASGLKLPPLPERKP